jgi:hypothetical protein
MKDAQATGEAFSSLNSTTFTSKHENSLLFLFLCLIFDLLDPDPDADPATQINADPQPCLQVWSSIRTVFFTIQF